MVFEREFLIRGVTGQNLANQRNWGIFRHELMATQLRSFVGCENGPVPGWNEFIWGWFKSCSAGYPRHISKCPNMAWAENMKCRKKWSKIGGWCYSATQNIEHKFHQVGRLWKNSASKLLKSDRVEPAPGTQVPPLCLGLGRSLPQVFKLPWPCQELLLLANTCS